MTGVLLVGTLLLLGAPARAKSPPPDPNAPPVFEGPLKTSNPGCDPASDKTCIQPTGDTGTKNLGAPSPNGDEKLVPQLGDYAPRGGAGTQTQASGQPQAGVGLAPEAAAQASRSQSRALDRAQAAGDSLLRGLRPADDGLGGAPDGAAAAPSPGAAGQALTVPPEPGDPKTPRDLAVAGLVGFGGSFSALGLKLGPGAAGTQAILRRDGSPASAQDLSRLAERIRSEPLALMTRPDFFSVIKREDFFSLKKEFEARPELRQDEFKHIDLSGSKRDFLHSESCSKVSGSCNAYTKTTSYRRGDYVPPEDLNSIWAKIQAEADKAEPRTAAAKPTAGAPPSGLGASRLRIAERVGAMLGHVSALLGSWAGGASAAAPRDDGVVLVGSDGARAAARTAATASARPLALDSRRPPAAAIPPARAGVLDGPARPFWPAAAVALLLLVFLLFRRRRASEQG